MSTAEKTYADPAGMAWLLAQRRGAATYQDLWRIPKPR